MPKTGKRNLITDVPGLMVGNADDAGLLSGVTIVVADEPVMAAADVRGGAPGTIETDLLNPENLVNHVDAISLSGGSAFGLSTAVGVQSWLRARGRGFEVGPARIPIVPGAILFDLLNGGDKTWDRHPPYIDLGHEAAEHAAADFLLGSVGAGMGATTFNLKGGLGSASEISPQGYTVGALVAVNAAGMATVADTKYFRAAPFEIAAEFGGLGYPAPWPDDAHAINHKAGARRATTLAVVACDAALTRSQAKRVAVMAHDGLARALYPVHTQFDGDIVFALATGKKEIDEPALDVVEIGAVAANCLARAVARGIYEAESFAGGIPSWKDRFAK